MLGCVQFKVYLLHEGLKFCQLLRGRAINFFSYHRCPLALFIFCHEWLGKSFYVNYGVIQECFHVVFDKINPLADNKKIWSVCIEIIWSGRRKYGSNYEISVANILKKRIKCWLPAFSSFHQNVLQNILCQAWYL